MVKFIILTVSAAMAGATIANAEIRTKTYWETQKLQIPLQSSSLQTRTTLIFEQITEASVDSICEEWIPGTNGRWERATCYDYECAEGGTGSSKAWNRFYNAKRDERAKILAAAIQGIGEGSAKSLIEKGYFDKKPRSWNEFKAAIRQAGEQGVITKTVASSVLGQYQKENMEALGYKPGQCQVKTNLCDQFVEAVPGHYESKACVVTDREVTDRQNVTFDVNVTNAVLQESEKETLELELSPKLENITMTGAYFNQYQLSADYTGTNYATVAITGIQRNRVSLPSRYFIGGSLKYLKSQNTMEFAVQVDPRLIGQGDEELVLEYAVNTCSPGWTGFCGVGWDATQPIKEVVITQGTTIIGVNVAPGDKAEVEYSIRKRNSRFYNANPFKSETSTERAK
jgi:hypothetical protein